MIGTVDTVASRSDAPESGQPHRRHRDAGPPLAVLTRLFEALEREQVRYCHWKSTTGIPRGLAGLTDLDLLVDRADAARFRTELERLAFKPLVSAPTAQYPGLEDHLGFDESTGRLVHLHVHYRLVLGAEHVKNHLLPLESAFLASTHLESGVRVPPPALEAAVLAIRVLLKGQTATAQSHRASPVRRFARGRSGEREAAHVASEFADLRPRFTDAELMATLARDLPFLPPDLIFETIAEATGGPAPTTPTDRSRRLRHALRPYERMPASRAILRGLRGDIREGRLGGRILRPLLPARRRKVAAGGGLAIAIIGSDGSGKSTIVREVAAWLGWRLDVRTAYMGTSRPSTGGHLRRIVSQGAAIVDIAMRKMFGGRAARVTARVRGETVAARHLADARDRQRRSVEGRRLVGQGWIVLFDRYPLAGAFVRGRPIDGARLVPSADDGEPGRDPAWLARAARTEADIYAGIAPPDLVIVLRVSPDVARARKPDHDRVVLAEKAASIAELADSRPGLEVIDADRPLEVVLLDVKRVIWRCI